MQIEQRIERLLTQLRARAPDDILDQAADEVAHAEYGVALEDLAENLYERNVALSAGDIAAFAELAQAIGLREHRWSFIRQLERRDA